MGKTKILMTRSLLPVDQEYITTGLKELVGDSFELIAPASYDETGILSAVDEVDVLLGPYVTKAILEKGRNIRLIQVPWTGMDTFDFSAMEGSKVPVCNSHSNASVVAELCVTLLADLLKKVSYHDRKWLNYTQVLEYIRKSKCLIEVMGGDQDGVTLRAMEAICYNKKLITNNSSIRDLDFYRSGFIQTFTEAKEINTGFIKNDDRVDYHYYNEFSPIHLIDRINFEEMK